MTTSKSWLQIGAAIWLLAVASLAVSSCGDSGSTNAPPPTGPVLSCSSNGNCPPNLPYCGGSYCVQCLGDGNCAGTGQPVCSVTGKCINCRSNLDCGAGRTCDPNQGCIVQTTCGSSANCAIPRPYCGPNGVCVECLGDGNCSGAGGNPYCVSNACVECVTNLNCGGGNPYCSPQNECVECLTLTNCPTGCSSCGTDFQCHGC
jgi:Cys-rich repeat protein